ncbi:pyridoxamine 5'-phosphate oxidase family protein [Corynebacterium sp. AOP40-9SA-29]|uniref:pyridoxamine 5'-phosphate oxidase family protein n=1 Tax=Corynebacterium sp. AOP40-9SA-29 TaxID=3457677 RepID=UPI0040341E1D
MNYDDIAFDEHVRARQQARGVSNRVDTTGSGGSELDARDIKLIRQARMFMMSTVTGTGWPYVQHKGGPSGFVKVLGDGTQLMFPDFAGNRQFVTAGNLDRDGRVCLFFVDFATRSRVKVFGHARTVEASDAPELVEQVRDLGERRITSVIERVVIVDVEASDANCTKQITPRWTREEVEERLDLYRADIAALKDEIAALRASR